MKREDGFYWVRWYNEWMVAKWTNDTGRIANGIGWWDVPGWIDDAWEDDAFAEIDEHKLVRTNT